MSVKNSISVRTQRLNKLILCRMDDSNTESNTKSLNRDALLDAFDVLYNECNKDALKNANILDFTKKFRDPLSEVKRMRVKVEDFTIKSLIGKGYFGEVHLAIENVTRDVYAIKKIPKTTFAQSKEERNVMAISRSEWIPTLQYAFQDQSHLYLAMEYLPGGDLFSLMVRRGIFAEKEIQFYLAEITLALNYLHSVNYVHRDIKPENILLDRLGHFKLTDFGSAAVIEKGGHVTSYTPIGTPDYIAPEILQPIHSRRPMKTTYNETCDFWSMGVIAYEMLTESNPFRCDSVHDTYTEILAYIDSKDSKKLQFPCDADVSEDLKNLINGLVVNKDNRLGYQQIRMHTFFDGIDWLNTRHQVPPIIPILNGEHDTSNFEEDCKKTRRNNTYNANSSTNIKISSFSGNDLPFVGFSYVHNESSDVHESESNRSEVSRLKTQVKSLQKIIDNQTVNIGSLQHSSTQYQKMSEQMASVQKILEVTKNELHSLKEKLKEKTFDVANCRTQIKTLKNSLKIEEEQRAKNDANISDILNSTYRKWERAKKLSEQNYEKQIAEKNSEMANLQQKLKLFEKELESKSKECANLQKTVDDLKDRLKSSKNRSSSDKIEFVKKHRESNINFEGQLRELRTKLQKQTEARHSADDENQKLRNQIEENNQKIESISDQRSKLDQANTELIRKLNQEIEENSNLRDEKHRIMQQMQEMTNGIHRNHRSIISPTKSVEGNVSVYSSLESLSSNLENQLKRDLELAKECENEQRSRANDLERTVARLEGVIERFNKQEISTVEEFLERKNEKLTEELRTVHEKAKIEQKMRSTACLEQWKSQKELESVNLEKQRLEQITKKVKEESYELEQRMKENGIVLRSREERITELQGDLAALKKEIQNERSRWEKEETERKKDKAKIVVQDTKIYKLEIDLDECRSKMHLFEQQKDALTLGNQDLIQRMRKECEDLEEAEEKQKEYQKSYEALGKNHDMLKKVCSLMETQLNELEEMYDMQLEQNKAKSSTVDKLWADIRDRDGRLLKLQQELRDEKVQKVDFDQKSLEISNELCKVRESLNECNEKLNKKHQELLKKTENLLEAEELIEVQKEEVQNLQRVNQTIDRELVIMKEDNSKIRTEWAVMYECNEKLNLELKTLRENNADVENEIEQLNTTISELHKYQKERELKSDATQSQYKKLIDYLQKRNDELTQKKKKTLAEVLFGSSNNSSKKENIPPPIGQLQDELKREKIRKSTKSTKLTKEPNSTAKSEIRVQSISNKEPKVNDSKVKSKMIISAENMEMHSFERITQSNGSNTAEICLVCKKHFLPDSVYQCQKCMACVHQYCRGGNNKCTGHITSIDTNSSDCTSMSLSSRTEYNGIVVLKEIDSTPALSINCIHEIDESFLLLGCASGIKAFNVDTEKLIHVANIDNVISIATVPTFPKSLLICDNGRNLLQCDLRQLETRAKAAVCLNTSLEFIKLDISDKRTEMTYDEWRFVRIFDKDTEPIAIAATQTQIIIWRYNVKYQRFEAIHFLDTEEPVQSIYFTSKLSAIVSSNKFFEIDLMNLYQNRLEYEEFCDECDETLAHTYKSKPLNSFGINGYEYLLCFKDFGVFVDEYGRRSRSNDIKWLNSSATEFAYQAPILFVFSEEGIQMIRVKKITENDSDNDDEQIEEKMLQTFISAKNARFGTTFGKYGVYALTSSSNVQESDRAVAQQVIQIDGTKSLRNALTDSLDTVMSSGIDC